MAGRRSMSRSGSPVREDGQLVIAGSSLEDKAYAAYQLRQSGKPWDVVAKTVGYGSGKSAEVEVRQYITKAAIQMDNSRKEEVLGLELDRLDTLQSAVWDQAMDGDTKAVDSVLRIMTHRAKLLGLELIAQGQGTVTNNTVVVTGNSEEFIRSLKLVDES